MQCYDPALNLGLPWTSFGRLRPLHTSAVIFAFGGNVLIATSFYVVQRTCRAGSSVSDQPLKFTVVPPVLKTSIQSEFFPS